MIGVRSNQLSTIVDTVFDIRYVGTAVDGHGSKCGKVLIVCRHRKWLDGQFRERGGQITEGWKLAGFGRIGENGFQIGVTGAIEAHSLKDQAKIDGPITTGVFKRQSIKPGTTEIDHLL